MAMVPVEKLEMSGANIYEVAIAAAKEARRLNEIRMKKLKDGLLEEQEIGTKVTVQALRSIAQGRAKITYPSEKGRRNHAKP